MRNFIPVTISFLFFASLNAVALDKDYLQAIDLAKAKRFSEAATLFKQQEAVYKDQPVFLHRSQAWHALMLLADDNEEQAEKALLPVVCRSLNEADLKAFEGSSLARHCVGEKALESNARTQLDIDMVTASITALGSLKWRDKDYLTALKLLALASARANEESTVISNTDFILEKVQQKPADSPEQQIAKAQIAEQLLVEGVHEKALAKGPNLTKDNAIGQEALQKLAHVKMAEAMAQMQQQQAVVLEALKNNSMPSEADLQVANQKNRKEQREQKQFQRDLAKTAAKEPDYFYSIADEVVCEYDEAPDIKSVSDVESHLRESLAGYLEAGRGQLFESYRMADGGVVQALNHFLDINEPLRALSNKFDLANRQRNRFLENLAFCADTLNLDVNFSQAFMSLLTRKIVDGLGEEHIMNLIKTQQRLAKSGRFSDPMAGKQESMRSLALGEFYLRAKKPAQALPELRKAFDGLGFNKSFEQIPEFAHLDLLQSAKILKSIFRALEQTKGDIAEVKTKQNVLESRMNELQTLLTSEPGTPTDEANLSTAKAEINKGFSSPRNQDALAQLQEFTAGMSSEDDKTNPSVQINALLSQLNSGEMDGEMSESLKQIQEKIMAQAPTQLEGVWGTELEREFHRHNHYLLLQLVLTQFSLDVRELKPAEQRLQNLDGYLRKHPGWINTRIEAYRQYTRGRLLIAQDKLSDAATAYRAAVEGWYFSPHSMLDISFSPLEDNTEILSQALDLALRQNQIELALGYVELMRDASWNNENIYGASNKAVLAAENAELQMQFKLLLAKAQTTASTKGAGDAFIAARNAGITKTNKSQRAELNKALILLTELEPLRPWLEHKDVGSFVGKVIRQANREQALRLQIERKEYLAKEMGVARQDAAQNARADMLALDSKNFLTLGSTLQAKLPEDTLLLSIWMDRDNSFIFAVDRQQIRAQKIPSAELARDLTQFNRRRLFNPRYGNNLYENLVAPYLSSKLERLVIVSNGALQNAPFAAFSTDPENSDWLGEKYLIRSLPRARQLLANSKPNPKPAQVLVLDGSEVPNQVPLENAESEIANLFQHFKGDHINPEALRKEKIIPLLNQYPLVHFAGHSVLNGDIPDYSSMKLFEQDLYLAELEQLDLNNVDLMVLGSCESATTREALYGDEFSSLQQSLHAAGVESVLATLYKVDDELSSVLISHFYQQLAKGTAKDKALQLAQKAARDYASENAELEENHNWAAFVLSGSPLPI